jgi:hypothetical protein
MRTREQLIQDAEPFPDKLVQKLPPRGDSYVPWYQYAQRLLLHHPDHEYRVTSVTYAPPYTKPNDDGEFTAWVGPVWAVTVQLEIGGLFYSAVGEDDSAAAAESNGYKRACAKAGIGLHLYDEKGYWLHGRLLKDTSDE